MTDYNAETRRLPRWVKIAGLAIAILAVLGVLGMILLGGGDHGPGRHSSNDSLSNEIPSHSRPAAGH
jgi:hypothetical protein